jgi:bromodomain adjacent to zinc finger domain protein 1B
MEGLLIEKAKKRKTKKEKTTEEASEEGVKQEEEAADDEEEEEEWVGRDRWVEAIRSCTTWSRMHLLLAIMESCMKWEKSAENAVSHEEFSQP